MPSAFESAYDPERFRELGHRVVDLCAEHLAAVQRGDLEVLPRRGPADQLAAWPRIGDDSPLPEDALAAALQQAHHLHHPRSVGHQVTPPLPEAALSDLVAAFLNNSAAIFEMGTVATVTEQRVVRWMCDSIGFDSSSDGLITSGGSLGNMTALLAMRQRQAGYDVWTEGHRPDFRPAILVGELTHYCVARAARILGFGEAAVRSVPCDDRWRMDPAALEAARQQAIADGRQPIGVVASACSTATGSIDDLDAVADFCEAHDLWMHVDGAHGASFCISAREKIKLRGLHRADSVVWDAHKTMLMPSLVTGVLFKRGADATAAPAPRADYLFVSGDDAVDLELGRRTIECTKPAMALKVWVSLAAFGEERFARYLEEIVDVVGAFADAIELAPDFELACRPDANIVCFRHRGGSDAHQIRIREAVVGRARWFITRTDLRGTTWLRCTVLHPHTTVDDLTSLLDEIRAVAEPISAD